MLPGTKKHTAVGIEKPAAVLLFYVKGVIPLEMTITKESDGVSAQFTLDIEQDAAKNTSVVRITRIEMRRIDGANVGACWITGEIYIDGKKAAALTLSNTHACGISLGPTYTGGGVDTWSGYTADAVTIAHNGDGTKSVTIRASLNVATTRGVLIHSFGANFTAELPRVPRVSTIEITNGTLGENTAIQIQRFSSSFKDTLKWSCGTQSGVVATQTADSRITWKPDIALAAQEPNKATVNITFEVTTYSGNTAIGTGVYTFSFKIPATLVPNASFRVSDKNGYMEMYGAYLQGQSVARVQTDASGVYGSTIKDIAVSCGGLTAKGSDVSFSLSYGGDVAITITVTDSRGMKAIGTLTIKVFGYPPPTAVITSAYRCDDSGNILPGGDHCKITFDASIYDIEGNSLRIWVVRKVYGTSEEISTELTSDYRGMKNIRGGTTVFYANIDTDYECSIRIQDKFATVNSNSVIVSVAFALLDFYRNNRAIGIGMRATGREKISMGFTVDMTENRIINLSAPQDETDAATKDYVDQQINSIRNALGLS